MKEGDQIDFAALLTDQYGRSYVAQDPPGYVVQNGALRMSSTRPVRELIWLSTE